MDVASTAAQLIGAKTAQTQELIAARLMKMNAQSDSAVADLLQAADQGVATLVKAATAGVGALLDVSV